MDDMDTRELMDVCDGMGDMKAAMKVIFNEMIVVYTSVQEVDMSLFDPGGWCVLYPFDPGGLRNPKIQRQTEKTQYVLEKAHSVDALAEDLELYARNKAEEHIMDDMDTRELMDVCDGRGHTKAVMNVIFNEMIVFYTSVQEVDMSLFDIGGWCMLYPFDPGGCI
ncbi:hypothetical protein GOP47_0019358 [Adiantum capillus-veneris]|uniref:Uncharacterized protein n=1 Tax=Adiantum capillus-veneris TaxID=13818 RepID=A0A9D4UG39_ADICA|nr:hypothetical protein GOP47_0019358 [Adiantum capillus-veneris]